MAKSESDDETLAHAATLGDTIAPPGPRRPEGVGDPLGMQLLKRALFPKRVEPVQIGRFNVLRSIGQGGMGAVYSCYDEVLDRKVAVKILKLDSREREVASARLVREGQALGRLTHPNVVTVHEVGTAGEDVYVAMEYVTGESLDVWAGDPSRTWEEIVDVFVQAGRGLEAAHRVSIIHRDFKPQNVMVNQDGLVKVLDFGLARASGHEVQAEWLESQRDGVGSTSSSALARALTVTGTLVGTPAYMSPEQYRGEPVTAASDQFSFCVSLYQCLYGALPFSTSSLEALRGDIMAGRVASAPLRSPAPAWVYRTLRRGMSADPAERYASMDELLAGLDHRRGARTKWLAAAAVAVAVAGAGGFMVATAADPAVEICPDAQVELAGVWDAALATSFAEAVRTTGSPRAGEVVDRVVPYLDRYAEEWAKMRNKACMAHAEGLQSDAVFDRGMACLDQRRAGLEALAGVLEGADADNLEGLVQAARALPALDRCGDAAALLAEVSPPEDPEIGARVQAHRESLARVGVLHWSGDYARAMELIKGVTADDAAMAYLPLAAELELERGFLEWELLDTAAAERSLERAMLTAVRGGHTSVAAQASSRLAYFRGVILAQSSRVEADLPMVEALNSRVEDDVDLYAEYLNNTAMIVARSGERERAERLLQAAVDLRARSDRDRTPLALGTLNNLGVLARKGGRIEESERALRQALARSQELLGETATASLTFERQLARSLRLLGRPREASEGLHRILRHAEALRADTMALNALSELGAVELDEGDIDNAREHLNAALELAPTNFGSYDDTLLLVMLAAARAQDEPSMISAYDRARDRLQDQEDPIGYRRGMLDYHYGLALTALGRPREALVPLERLRSSLSPELIAAYPVTGPRLSLALGVAYRLAGELDAAQAALDRALEGFGENWTILRADALHELGLVALSRERGAEAAQLLSRAESLYLTTAESDYQPLAKARLALAKARTPARSSPTKALGRRRE